MKVVIDMKKTMQNKLDILSAELQIDQFSSTAGYTMLDDCVCVCVRSTVATVGIDRDKMKVDPDKPFLYGR